MKIIALTTMFRFRTCSGKEYVYQAANPATVEDFARVVLGPKAATVIETVDGVIVRTREIEAVWAVSDGRNWPEN